MAMEHRDRVRGRPQADRKHGAQAATALNPENAVAVRIRSSPAG